MLADDAALEDVVFQQGLMDALPKGGIHVCAGTHGMTGLFRNAVANATGLRPTPGSTSESFDKMVRQDRAEWGPVVKSLGMQLD